MKSARMLTVLRKKEGVVHAVKINQLNDLIVASEKNALFNQALI